MIVYKNYTTFSIRGQKINIISDDTSYGLNTVTEIDNTYFYLGDISPNITSAIYVWQKIHDKELNYDELQEVMIENNLISGGI